MCKLWINLPALASVPLLCLEVPVVPNLHGATGLTVYQGNTKAMTIYQGNTPKIQWVAWSCLHVGVRWMGYAPSVLDTLFSIESLDRMWIWINIVDSDILGWACCLAGLSLAPLILSHLRLSLTCAYHVSLAPRFLSHLRLVDWCGFTHVHTCNVTRVQSATDWTASVHTLHMSTPVM